MTQFLRLAALPRGQRQPGLQQLTAEIRADKRCPLVTALLMMVPKVLDAHDRHLAGVRCARVAVAAELYRRERGGRWPDNLEQLVPAFLAEVPADPFGDGPLCYEKLDDGAVVYSVGQAGPADRDGAEAERWDSHDTRPFFRLWDRDERGLPPD
jgi:hypothetical protein